MPQWLLLPFPCVYAGAGFYSCAVPVSVDVDKPKRRPLSEDQLEVLELLVVLTTPIRHGPSLPLSDREQHAGRRSPYNRGKAC